MFQLSLKSKQYPEFKIDALLAGFSALLGEVCPKLRSLNIDWDQHTVYLYFYYDGEVSDEDQEAAEIIATETISKFRDHIIEIKIVRVDFPELIPNTGIPIFLRKENDKVSEQIEKCSILGLAVKGDFPPRVKILFGVMKGFIGNITPNLRAVTLGKGNGLFFYYDKDISDLDRNNVASIATEVFIESSHKGKVDILRWDFPKPIPYEEVEVLYMRRESI